MRKRLFGGLMVCSVVIMLTGMPLQILHIDTVESAYAWGHKGGYHNNYWSSGSKNSGQNQGDNGNAGTSKIPEPATMALLGAGIAGVGVFSAIRYRKNKKK